MEDVLWCICCGTVEWISCVGRLNFNELVAELPRYFYCNRVQPRRGEGVAKKGFVMGSRTRCPGNVRKIYIGCPHPHKSELGDGMHGAGPLRVVLNSNSFADNL